MPDDPQLFGELAVERGLITAEQLETALRRQLEHASTVPLGEVLVQLGHVTRPQANALAKLATTLAEGRQAQADQADPDEEDLTGWTLGGCMLLEPIGTGAMGTTWRAHHLRLDRDVAVKVLHARLALIEGNVERFAREARAAARLDHPAIVSVYDFDQERGRPFIVMQYVEGQNLRQVINGRGPLGPRRALWVAARVLEGLAHAHAHGIVHRDIKPANLLITREPRIKIADFGLVRLLSLSTSERISSFGELVGTPQYMAPEQANCDEVDARTDLYALGISLWELVVGRPPFAGASTIEVLEQQIMSSLPPVRAHAPEAPAELEELLARLAAKEPAERFQSAEEALLAVQRIRAAEGSTQRVTRGHPSRDGTDRSREGQAPALVPAAALQGLKQRLRTTRFLGALTPADLEGELQPGSVAAPRQAAPGDVVEASFTGVAAHDPSLKQIRARLQAASADGDLIQLAPSVLHELLEAGRPEDALGLAVELEEAASASAPVCFFLGLAAERLERPQVAAGWFAHAARLAADHLPARLHLARVQVLQGLVDEAVATLEAARAWHPTSIDAAVRLAEVLYVVKGDARAALPAYERAIELAPARWQLRQQLAWIHYELGQLEAAEAVLTEVVAWRPEADAARELLARVRHKRASEPPPATPSPGSKPAAPPPTREDSPAVRACLDAIRLAEAGQRWDRVRELAEKGLVREPRAIPLFLALGRALREQGDLSRAVQVYGGALGLDPTCKEAQDGLIEVQRRRRKR